MNPLLRRRFPQFFKVAEDNMDLWTRWENSKSIKWRLAREAAVLAEASWRRMLVSQPTIMRLTVLYIIPSPHQRGLHHYKHRTLDFTRGLRMGQLYGIVVDHLKNPGTDFALDWSNALAGADETYDISMLTQPSEE